MRIALAGALVFFVLASPAGSALEKRAFIRIERASPLIVYGWGFQPRERVVVTVSSEGSQSGIAVAGPAGTFTKRFRKLSVSPCTMYRVRALGNKGSHAASTPPPPSCGTELQP
jgi:hypothetical protein